MRYAPFDRPSAKTRHVSPIPHGNCAVLVPKNRPIGLSRFVEQDGPNRMGRVAEESNCEPANAAINIQRLQKSLMAEDPYPRRPNQDGFGK